MRQWWEKYVKIIELAQRCPYKTLLLSFSEASFYSAAHQRNVWELRVGTDGPV